MALVSPNCPHAELIRDPDQPMEDDDTSTPHASSFDPSSRAMTPSSNPGSIIHSPMSRSHRAQFRVEKNTSDQTPVNAQETLQTKWNSLSHKSD